MCLSILEDRSLLKYLTLSIYIGVFIDQNLTWQKHNEYVLQRIRGKYISLAASILFQLYCGFILPFLTTVTLCGLLQLHYFKNLWSEYMPDLLVTCVMILVLLKLLLAECRHFHTIVQVHKILHHLACTCLPSGHIHVF